MLVWSRSGRFAAWGLVGVLIAVVYLAPIGIIVLASFAGQWNGILPSHATSANYTAALSGTSLGQVEASLVTGLVASLAALATGTWAALSLRAASGLRRRLLDLAFFVPSAVPSVSVGLGLLVAFSQPPLLLNGTIAIVVLAHLVLISAFSYGNVSAGLMRLPPEFAEIAASLGARPLYLLRRVTLPLLVPHLIAAVSLSFALSMGELGATIMVYPPGWVTLPVGIFALTDRGDIFAGSAQTMILVLVTIAVLVGLSLIPSRAVQTRQK